MANIIEQDQWEPAVYEFAENDPVQGGPGGIDNLPSSQLANRTLYLKNRLAEHVGAVDPHAQYMTKIDGDARIAAAIAAIVNASPASLDTLKELADALGDDANFAATMTNALALKAPLNSPVLTGTPKAPTPVGGADPKQLVNVEYLVNALATYNSLPSGLPLMWATLDCPAWAVVRDGSALTRTVYPNLYNLFAPTRACTITLNAAGAVVTGLARTADLWVGMPAEHASLPAGTTIKSIDSAVQVTLSANANVTTASASLRLFLHGYGNGGGALTFGLPDDRGLFERGLDSGARGYERTTFTGTTTLNSNIITGVTSTRGLCIGQVLSAPAGVTSNATITGISASTITMSVVSPATTAASITVIGGQIGNERPDTYMEHRHQSWVDSAHPYQPAGTIQDYLATFPQGGVAVGSIGVSITDGVNGTPRTGPETRGRFRNYLPIIVI